MQSRETRRQVCFEDCHVGDVFKISLDSPWYEKVGQHQFEFSSVTLFTTLTVKVEKIKPRDGTVLTRFYIDNTPTECKWWFFRTPGSDIEALSDNLEFLPKRKNNYW